jgi:hypothetical protein
MHWAKSACSGFGRGEAARFTLHLEYVADVAPLSDFCSEPWACSPLARLAQADK